MLGGIVADKSFGGWKAFRIRYIGARTWERLNDQLAVNDATMQNLWDCWQPLPAKGPIMLQTHCGEIRWHNLYVREIGLEEAAKLLAEADAKLKTTFADKFLFERGILFFADDRDEKADLYYPLDRGPEVKSPVVVTIHGGG